MVEVLVLLCFIIGGAIYSFIQGEKKATAEAEAKASKGVISDIKQAKEISEASSNDDYGKRVRDQFTRK